MKRMTLLAATLFFLGCSNSTNSNASGSNPTGKPSTSAKTTGNASAGSPASEIKVTLTGGANAGTYTVMSADPTCSEGLTGKNSFGNQYSADGKADNELSSLQMIIADKDGAKSGTDQFMITISFGKLFQGKSYEINGLGSGNGKSGSGKATLTEAGGTKTVVIEGKTADGVGISATIKCNNVING